MKIDNDEFRARLMIVTIAGIDLLLSLTQLDVFISIARLGMAIALLIRNCEHDAGQFEQTAERSQIDLLLLKTY